MEFEQAVIFAGGRGERLRPLTDSIPKPMAPINGRPFADYLLTMLREAGIKRVLFLLGYKAEKVVERYTTIKIDGLKIDYSVGTAEDQTGRRLINAYGKLEDKFLLLYGDNYWSLPLAGMKENYERLKCPLTTTVFSNKKGTSEYGFDNNVMVNAENRVVAYDKSRSMPGLNGVDIGFFLVDKKIIDPGVGENISFEEIILAGKAKEGRLGAFMTDEQYYYITTFDTLKVFEQTVKQQAIAIFKEGL